MKLMLMRNAACFFVAMLVPLPPGVSAADTAPPPTRAQLERAYANWRTAMITKDEEAWERATASSRKATTKNLMISQRHPFPRSLFAIPIRPPSVLQLRCLTQKAEGDRAQLIYFGKVDMGVRAEGGFPDNLLVLHFIREGGRWLFDSIKYANLAGMEAERAQLANGDVSLLQGGEFALPEGAPKVPRLVAAPDHIGHIQVTVAGYRTRVWINGHDCGVVENSNVTNLVIGGFHQGRNEMVVEVEELPLEDEGLRFFEINAFVMTGDSERPRARVFRYLPKEGAEVPGRLATEIWANAVTIEGRDR